VVRLGAVAQSAQAGDAQKLVAETVAKTIDAVKKLGIDEKSIRTAGVSLTPVYTDFQPRPGQQQQEPRISGYRASNTIEVRLDDLAKLGPVIDTGVSTGANNVEGVDFQLKDDGPQRKAALKQAATDARRDRRARQGGSAGRSDGHAPRPGHRSDRGRRRRPTDPDGASRHARRVVRREHARPTRTTPSHRERHDQLSPYAH
jgi:uncharacterized protein YggE